MNDNKPEGRSWIPAAYLDEIVPPGRPDPSDWIGPEDGAGAFVLYPAFKHDASAIVVKATPGDVVGFYWCDDHGEVLVRIERSGAFKADGAIPPEATHFWAGGDPDTLASTMEEFAEQMSMTFDADEGGASVEVRMATWAEKPVQFRLSVEAAGPKFNMVREEA